MAFERADEVSRSVDLKIKEAMDHIEKEDKIKDAKEKKKDKEAEEKKKDKESKEKKKDKKSKEKKKDKKSQEMEEGSGDTDEELSDDGEFFL